MIEDVEAPDLLAEQLLCEIVEFWRELRARAGHSCCAELVMHTRRWSLDWLASACGYGDVAWVGTESVQFDDGSVLWLARRGDDYEDDDTPDEPPWLAGTADPWGRWCEIVEGGHASDA